MARPATSGEPPARPAPRGPRADLETFERLARELRGSATALRLLIEGAADGLVDLRPGTPAAGQMLAHVRALSAQVDELGGFTDAATVRR